MKLATPISPRDHTLGPATAPLTLVEYGDYECSYCGRAFPIVKAVRKALGHQLRFAFRNYPLTRSHPHALHAAEVAEAVGLHDRFWEIHDLLFTHQATLDDRHLLSYAQQLGLDPDTIAREASSEAVATRIRTDMESGERSGISGTPTFYINGVKHEGAWDEPALIDVLERALAAGR